MAADSSLAIAVAEYVRELVCAETNRAEDRPALRLLAADAAGLLAEVVLGDQCAVSSRLEAHERVRGHTWVQGEVARELGRLWAVVRNQSSRPAI